MRRGRPLGARNKNRETRRSLTIFFLIEEYRRATGCSWREACRAAAHESPFRSRGSIEYQYDKGAREAAQWQKAGAGFLPEMVQRHARWRISLRQTAGVRLH